MMADLEIEPVLPDILKSEETISDTWKEIVYHCQVAGDYKSRYKVGDTKVASYGDEGHILMILVGFETDDLSDGSGKNHTTWCPKWALRSTSIFGWVSDTVTLPYSTSDLRTNSEDKISLLPKSLQNGILSVNKSCYLKQKGITSDDEIVSCRLWPLSEREVGVTSSMVAESSGPVYEYYNKNDLYNGKTPFYGDKIDANPDKNARTWTRSRADPSSLPGKANSFNPIYNTAQSADGRLNISLGFCL